MYFKPVFAAKCPILVVRREQLRLGVSKPRHLCAHTHTCPNMCSKRTEARPRSRPGHRDRSVEGWKRGKNSLSRHCCRPQVKSAALLHLHTLTHILVLLLLKVLARPTCSGGGGGVDRSKRRACDPARIRRIHININMCANKAI